MIKSKFVLKDDSGKHLPHYFWLEYSKLMSLRLNLVSTQLGSQFYYWKNRPQLALGLASGQMFLKNQYKYIYIYTYIYIYIYIYTYMFDLSSLPSTT